MSLGTAVFAGLRFSDADARLLAQHSPVQGRPLLDIDTVRGVLAGAGYGEWWLDETKLGVLVEHCNGKDEEFALVIGERRDASFKVDIADDAMTAWLELVPAFGGKTLTPADIYLGMGDAGVSFGIDEPAVRAACNACTVDRVGSRILAARGTLPEDGVDATFELLISESRDRVPKVDANGLVDFRDQGDIPVVDANQPLMRRIPATMGVDGHTVRGELLQATPGRNHPFTPNLIGAAPSADDANLLCALFKGQPVHKGNGVAVDQVLQISNVSMASGNINFDGTVTVSGDVFSDMQVHASGDIIVKGTVDGAHLEAGGNVKIFGGLISHATVRAGGSVTARFVEGAQVFAGTVIAIEDTSLQSDLQAINQIMVGIKNPQRGRLVGGSARAMLKISTPILGGENSGVTSLTVGVNPVLEASNRELLHEIEKQGAEEEKLQKLFKHLQQNRDKSGMLERVQSSLEQRAQAWATLLTRKDEMEKQLALTKGARIELSVGVAGAVDLAFGPRTWLFRHRSRAGAFVLQDDKVVFTDPSGAVMGF